MFVLSSLPPFLFSPQSHLGNVLVDMKLIDIKDTLPVGFIPIQETVDTRKFPTHLQRYCVASIWKKNYLTCETCWTLLTRCFTDCIYLLSRLFAVEGLSFCLVSHRGAGLQEEATLHQVYSSRLHRGSHLRHPHPGTFQAGPSSVYLHRVSS